MAVWLDPVLSPHARPHQAGTLLLFGPHRITCGMTLIAEKPQLEGVELRWVVDFWDRILCGMAAWQDAIIGSRLRTEVGLTLRRMVRRLSSDIGSSHYATANFETSEANTD